MQVLYCKKKLPPPPPHTHTYGPLFVCAYNVASSLLESLILRVLFRDVDGVIKRANATEYGLASGVFTKDLSKVCERSTTVYIYTSSCTASSTIISYKLLYFRTNSELWKTTILAINYRFLCIFCPPPACLLPPFNVAVRFYSLHMWNKNCSTYRSSKGRSIVPDLRDKHYHNMHANVFRWC